MISMLWDFISVLVGLELLMPIVVAAVRSCCDTSVHRISTILDKEYTLQLQVTMIRRQTTLYVNSNKNSQPGTRAWNETAETSFLGRSFHSYCTYDTTISQFNSAVDNTQQFILSPFVMVICGYWSTGVGSSSNSAISFSSVASFLASRATR